MIRYRPPIIILLFIAGCADAPQTDLRTTSMQIGSATFTLEIADTPEARQRGLMRRDSMPSDHGMIFVFPNERQLSFWMKNTRIPLDIIYLSRDGVVVSIHQLKPYDTTSVHSARPAQYAIELNQGAAAETGIKPGDMLAIPAEAQKSKD